jgi:hypothetical protein
MHAVLDRAIPDRTASDLGFAAISFNYKKITRFESESPKLLVGELEPLDPFQVQPTTLHVLDA